MNKFKTTIEERAIKIFEKNFMNPSLVEKRKKEKKKFKRGDGGQSLSNN